MFKAEKGQKYRDLIGDNGGGQSGKEKEDAPEKTLRFPTALVFLLQQLQHQNLP